MPTFKILCVIGTRPEAIKMAPLILQLQKSSRFETRVVLTNQHKDLVIPLLQWFGITQWDEIPPPAEGLRLAELTAYLLTQLDSYIAKIHLDLVIVQGDTKSVLTASLAAFFQKIPLAHLEAGLRTHDLTQPFPEEANRALTARIAQLHFCPTEQAQANLLQEGIAAESIHIVGNTVIDALFFTRDKLLSEYTEAVTNDERHILLTVHRRENFGAPLRGIFQAIKNTVEKRAWLHVTYPVHPNPNVRDVAYEYLGNHPQITLVPALEYPALVQQIMRSDLVLTDSGGIQEEAPALGKPVLILRETTERPEVVDLGAAHLVGSDAHNIEKWIDHFLPAPPQPQRTITPCFPYGVGDASYKTVTILERWFH